LSSRRGTRRGRKSEKFLGSALLAEVVEVKREFAGLRKSDADEERKEGEEKKPEDWDKELFAGYLMLHTQGSKNRDAWVMLSLGVPWWGNGFATEVVQWAVEHAFEQLGMHRMTLGVHEGNLGARRVYEKSGFVEEGGYRKATWKDGKWEDVIMMGILEHEYWERKTQKA